MAITPRSLTQALEGWRLDHELAFGLRAVDAYRIDQERGKVHLLFEGAGGDVKVVVQEAGEDVRAASSAHGLSFSYSASASDPDAAHALCRTLAERLSPRWSHDKCADAMPEALRSEVVVGPSSDVIDDRLQRDMAQYQRLYGARPSVRQVAVRGCFAGPSLHYPAPRNGVLPRSAALYPMADALWARRRSRLHFARLGLMPDAHRFPRTVPTPSTLMRALRMRYSHPIGIVLRERRALTMAAPEWVRFLLVHRMLPVTVAPSWLVSVHGGLRRAWPQTDIPADVGMLVHDVSLHALVYSDVPFRLWDELAALASKLVRRRDAAFRVAAFYEGTLTEACWRAHREASHPCEVPARISAQYQQLEDQLRDCA